MKYVIIAFATILLVVSDGDATANCDRILKSEPRMLLDCVERLSQELIDLEREHNEEIKSLREVVEQHSFLPPGAVIVSLQKCNQLGRGWKNFSQADGRFLLGVGKGPLDRFIGAETIGGEQFHKLTEDEVPAHNHGLNNEVSSEPNPPAGDALSRIAVRRRGEVEHPAPYEFGKSQPHNNMPPYLAVYFCQYEGG